jgi:rhamnosyltransferase subunit B
MRFALVTLGSAGDLRPYLAIAAELARRGHSVHLLGQTPYAEQVEREGVRFLPIIGQREHDCTLQHPDLWHPIRGLGVLWRHLFVPSVEPTYAHLEAVSGAGVDRLTVLAHPLAVGARFFREKHPIRLLTGYTAPTSLRSTADPMFLGSWHVPSICPAATRRALWRLLDAWKLEPMCRDRLEQWRTRWQTPSINGSIFGEWIHSPDGGIAMFPPAFQAPCGDWPAQVHQFGFPSFTTSDSTPLSVELTAFLEAGPRPLLIYGGSASSQQQRRHFEVLAEAARSYGFRTILVQPDSFKDSDQARDGEYGSDSMQVSWTNLPALLTQTCGFIHHGGIGSCADALFAQVPQLIVASAFDQFQNGYCIERMRAGHWLYAASLTPRSARRAIRQFAQTSVHNAAQRQPIPNTALVQTRHAATGSICDHLLNTSLR